jgi:hypothetical protein
MNERFDVTWFVCVRYSYDQVIHYLVIAFIWLYLGANVMITVFDEKFA